MWMCFSFESRAVIQEILTYSEKIKAIHTRTHIPSVCIAVGARDIGDTKKEYVDTFLRVCVSVCVCVFCAVLARSGN